MATFNGSGGSAASASASSSGSASPLASGLSTTKQEQTAVDAWIVQKLKNEWSSCEFGGLLTKDKISDAVTSFRHLDTPIKVRFLLSFLSMRREDVEESKFSIVEIIDAAENDSEEWVKISAGVVKQYMFMSEDGSESGDTFFHEQLAKTISKVLEAVNAPATSQRDGGVEEFFCHEDAFLNPSARPEVPVKPAKHFAIVESSNGKDEDPDERSSEKKPALHRPQMPRPLVHPPSSNVPTRITPTSSKPPPPKKNMTELSEIRRKADAGRFKRHRSRISMIDIDEVKQIESEKAQKAEERKKQKVVAKDKATSGSGQAAEKSGSQGGDGSDEQHDGQDESSNAPGSNAESYSQHNDDEDHRDAHGDRDDHDDDHGNSGQHQGSDEERNEYIPDGTQALLNAAFHSTKDIMTEVVSQQQSMHHQSHQLHHHNPYEQEQQQQHYHRGFEPEDATQHIPYGYGFNSTYSSHFSDQGYMQQQQQQHPYQQQQVQNQYGAGFMDEQAPQPPGPGQYRQPGFDGTQNGSHNNSSYMDGPPEYWR